MTDAHPLVSVLVLSWRRPHLLRRCLESVRAQDFVARDVIVLANGCAETAAMVRTEYPEARLIDLPENIGSAPGRNRVAEEAQGTYFLFLDDDGEIRAPDTITRLVERLAAEPRVGIASMGLYDAELDEPTGWSRSLGPVPYSCYHDGFAGGACLVRAEAFRASGGYLDGFSGPSEEFGLAVRIYGAGWAIRHCPDVVFHHHVAKTLEHWRELVYAGYAHLQYVVWRLYPAPWHVLASLRVLATHLWIDLRQNRGRRVFEQIGAAIRWARRGRRDRTPIGTAGLSALYAAKYYRIDDPATLDAASRGVLPRIPFLRVRRKWRSVPKLPWGPPSPDPRATPSP